MTYDKVHHWITPPEMLNLLSPDILRICTDMIIQIILSGYSIVGWSGYGLTQNPDPGFTLL